MINELAQVIWILCFEKISDQNEPKQKLMNKDTSKSSAKQLLLVVINKIDSNSIKLDYCLLYPKLTQS